MRPAGKGDLESLYFNYPYYEFRKPAELNGERPRHTVAIVGAGPVGLVAAIELGRRGIGCVLLDNKDTLNDGSRALCISRYSMETLQQLGVSERFADKGLGWTHGRSYFHEKMIYRLEMPHSDEERFYPMYNLQQQYMELYLADRCTEFPETVEMRWQNRVAGVQQSDDGVSLNIETPEGDYTLEADYVFAADGGKSMVRQLLGLRLRGENLPGDYVIADVRMDHDFPTERRCFFESSANPDATILVHKQPENIWRIDYQLQPGESADDALKEENIHRRVQDILSMIGHDGDWELEWWSIYTANTLCLDEYRHNRVIFIGDAAHIVPIFGVRGLNNGVCDAVNAAWKLAYVIDGVAPESLLDSYTAERRGATLEVFSNAGKSSRFMTPPTRGYELMRRAVLELSLTEKFTRPFANPRQVTPYTYADSPVIAEDDNGFAGGPAPGAPAINRRIGPNDFLLDYLGQGFTGLYFCTSEIGNTVINLCSELRTVDPEFTMLSISRTPLVAQDVPAISDPSGTIFDGYSATDGSLYLLRPDRHICGRWIRIDTENIVATLKGSLARSS